MDINILKPSESQKYFLWLILHNSIYTSTSKIHIIKSVHKKDETEILSSWLETYNIHIRFKSSVGVIAATLLSVKSLIFLVII